MKSVVSSQAKDGGKRHILIIAKTCLSSLFAKQ
jgi:hypothetical protein